MNMKKIACLVAGAAALGIACLGLAAGEGTPAERRAAAHKAFDAGNFNDAYKTFAALATVDLGVDCLAFGKECHDRLIAVEVVIADRVGIGVPALVVKKRDGDHLFAAGVGLGMKVNVQHGMPPVGNVLLSVHRDRCQRPQ